MIYFLVNNNYHYIDTLKHCMDLQNNDKALIQIPHTLTEIKENRHFKDIYTFYTPFKELKNYFNIYKVKKVEKNITKSLNISERDILFVYTEYEILNQYVIDRFHKTRAKVYIIEDGGFPTYLTYSVKSDKSLPVKKLIKLLYLKYILGYNYVEFLYYNNIIFPQISEKYIDGVLLYLDVPILRKIKKYIIQSEQKEVSLDKTKAIFLNEKLYDYYCTREEYEAILDDAMSHLSENFKEVYFKFHPRESVGNRIWQLNIVSKYTNVTLIDNNEPIENILEIYNAKYVFSYLSAALLNLKRIGATPIYIFHMYPELSTNPVFVRIQKILIDLNYKFINDFDTVYEDFDFGQNENKINIKSLIYD